MSGGVQWGAISDDAWSRRMRLDKARAEQNQSAEQRAVTTTAMARALDLGAQGFALTGSTARRRRTTISDLDYHVIGARPDLTDLPGEVDIVASSATRFLQLLDSGDDFGQWTLRYGCILYDAGIMKDAARRVVNRHLWPSGDRKLERLADHRREAERLLLMGDRDAAQEQIRATLTALARGLLLQATVFPLARSELPEQLESVGYTALARALDDTIFAEPDLEALSASIRLLDITSGAGGARSAA